ncbi:unnamed protein product [Lepeophtheirus salmonis]|uniref:(salmon louse) hypothetical protein n=1 Tax=Lepeophtheirus salmonis TaxID=72036 RepID=A0A7R8CL31_LEPSM|nr:unnamed protein product [Lepeophtheirus salmonis]CAF2825083.1 unnamed protein product [Lepeophtheirus salmonis]
MKVRNIEIRCISTNQIHKNKCIESSEAVLKSDYSTEDTNRLDIYSLNGVNYSYNNIFLKDDSDSVMLSSTVEMREDSKSDNYSVSKKRSNNNDGISLARRITQSYMDIKHLEISSRNKKTKSIAKSSIEESFHLFQPRSS